MRRKSVVVSYVGVIEPIDESRQRVLSHDAGVAAAAAAAVVVVRANQTHVAVERHVFTAPVIAQRLATTSAAIITPVSTAAVSRGNPRSKSVTKCRKPSWILPQREMTVLTTGTLRRAMQSSSQITTTNTSTLMYFTGPDVFANIIVKACIEGTNRHAS